MPTEIIIVADREEYHLLAVKRLPSSRLPHAWRDRKIVRLLAVADRELRDPSTTWRPVARPVEVLDRIRHDRGFPGRWRRLRVARAGGEGCKMPNEEGV